MYNVDFLWLAEGLVPDPSTLTEFFSKFRPELKSLFKQICKIAMTMGLIRVMPNKEMRGCSGVFAVVFVFESLVELWRLVRE